MIPIKILCQCGQKYAFDAEPVGPGRSVAVQCPFCGSDGTSAANKSIADHLAMNDGAAPALRIAGQRVPASIPLPRPIPAAAKRDRPSLAVKVRWKRPILVLGGAAAALLVLASVVMLGRGSDRKAEPIRPSADVAPGLPTTLVALNAWYSEPPPGQNAATYYARGFNALQLGTSGASELPFWGSGQMPALGAPIPASMKSALATMVKSNQDALRFLAQGAQCSRCRYALDLTRGFDLIYRPFPKLEKASLFLELSALYHADSNHAEQAARELLIGLALADSLGEVPTTLAQLLRARTITYALAGLEQTLDRSSLPSGVASELLNALQKMERADARGDYFNRTLAGERAMGLGALADPGQLLRGLAAPDLRMTADQRKRIKARLRTGEKLTAERDFFEASFSRLIASRQAPFPDRLNADVLGRQLVAEATEKGLVVLDLLLPSLGRRTALEANCLARLRMGCTAVALEQFLAEHDHRYPAALSELAPDYFSAIPVDPFDGQPLRYKKEDGGYKLSSIGANGDIVFAVARPVK